MPFRRKYRRRRFARKRRRPVAKTKVDKRQNRRIRALEAAPMLQQDIKQYQGLKMTNVLQSSGTSAMNLQISEIVLPPSTSAAGYASNNGQWYNLKSLQVKGVISRENVWTHSGSSVQKGPIRVMVFWDTDPTYTVPSSGAAPLYQLNPVTWENLVHDPKSGPTSAPLDPAVDPNLSVVQGFRDMNMLRNKRFKMLYDKTFYPDTNKALIPISLYKRYSKLKINNGTFSGDPVTKSSVNRKLYIAYASTASEAAQGEAFAGPILSFQTNMRYTVGL